MGREGVFIHDTAEVSSKAEIGSGTKIWNLVQVREGVKLGSNCILSKNVYVDAGVSVGNNVKVQNNVSVYAGVTIENDVFVGPSVVFTNDFRPRAVAPSWEITETLVKTGASLGANSTLVCGITVGEYAMVAAGAVVTKSVSPHVLVAGNPAEAKGYVYRNGYRVKGEHLLKALNEKLHFIHPESGEELVLNAEACLVTPKL